MTAGDWEQQPFLDAGGRVPEWLEFRDQAPYIEPDKYGAAQLLLAAMQDSVEVMTAEFNRILRERPAVPLLGGVIYLGIGFAGRLYGDNAVAALNSLALAYGMEEGSEET